MAQSDAEIALAKQWFRDGEAAEKKKDWAKALELFEKALTVKQTPQIYLRVGALQERLGKLVEALVSYERAQEKAAGAHTPTRSLRIRTVARRTVQTLIGSYDALSTRTRPFVRPRCACRSSDSAG